MSHRRRRISRVLLAVLVVTIGVGLVTYIRRLNSTRASESAMATATAAPAAATQPQPQPDTRPSVAALPAVVEAAKQAQPRQASAPFRTETPGLGAPALLAISPTPALKAGAVPLGAPAGTNAKPGDPKATDPKATEAKPTDPKAASSAAETANASIKAQAPVSVGPVATAGGADAIGQAKARMQAGKLLEARDLANGPLVAGRLSGADADAARALLSEINQTLVFSTRKFPDDRFGTTYQVLPGDRLDRIGAKHALTADMLMRLNGLSDPRRLRAGAYIKVLKGPFHAVVNKGAFRLDLYLGGLPGSGGDVAYVASFPVGLGKDDSTPVGKWQVEQDRKVKNPVYYSPRGEGVIEADDPNNPLGEFWIGLTGLEGDALGKESYGIHGTIDPSSIGRQESMGCIRMKNQDVAVVFSALVEGKSTVQVVE
jgi:LysM repeat protein